MINSWNYIRIWHADQFWVHKESTQEVPGQGFTAPSFYSLSLLKLLLSSTYKSTEEKERGGEEKKKKEEKRQKELIFHVLLEQPFENSGVFKANMFLLWERCWTAGGSELNSEPAARAAHSPARSNLKHQTKLSRFSPGAVAGFMLPAPNYIRHLILNLRYLNVKPYNSNSHKAVGHSISENGFFYFSPLI